MRTPILLLTLLCNLCLSLPLSACTGIRVQPNDGSIIAARTLEFAVDTQSRVIVIPRGQKYQGTTNKGPIGAEWTAQYAVTGTTPFGYPHILDGFNEKGLYVGLFYFPGYAEYFAEDDGQLNSSLAPWELGTFLLTQYSSVEEVREAVAKVRVVGVVLDEFGFVPPMHYVVHDASGKAIVIEHTNGELRIHENPLGVMTNSPTFDWHMTNLRNYVNLRVSEIPTREIQGKEFSALGIGSGMLGLPGDFTPPSRFVRAVAFSQASVPVATAEEGILQAFHILNQFDIPKGVAREGEINGKPLMDYTVWTSASDLSNLKFYFHTYESRHIRMLSLMDQDLNAPGLIWFSMSDDPEFEAPPMIPRED